MKQSILAILLILTSCMSETEVINGSAVKANYDKATQSEISIPEIKYIPLETNKSSLIGSIDKLLYKNNHFYILDKRQNEIFIFNQKGKYVSSIKQKGEGPGEYLELIDMDVDNEGNIYVADNGRAQIIKYMGTNAKHYQTIPVKEHFMEFCSLNEHQFILMDVFGSKDRKMKLALFDSNQKTMKPLLVDSQKTVNELSIMRCSKNYLCRSNEHIYYNDRYTPTVYSIDKNGSLQEALHITSDKYISYSELKGMENNVSRFIQDNNHIKDLISIYETDSMFVCMPFITPSDEYLFIPKSDASKSFRAKLMNQPKLFGISLPIKGVINNYMVASMNYSDKVKKALPTHAELKKWKEEDNPVLVLFSLEKKS